MGEWLIGLHLLTAHLGELPDPGAHRALATPGVYVIAPSGATFGAYRNSLSGTPRYPGDRWTAYAGWTWRPGLDVGPLRDITITIAGATGYMRPVVPLVGIGANLGANFRLLWVPHRTHPVSVAVEF